jgi:hypothetical protein
MQPKPFPMMEIKHAPNVCTVCRKVAENGRVIPCLRPGEIGNDMLVKVATRHLGQYACVSPDYCYLKLYKPNDQINREQEGRDKLKADKKLKK